MKTKETINHITINGIEREIIFTRKNIKNINVKVKRDLKIYLNAPLRLPVDKIKAYLTKITPWLDNAFKKQEARFSGEKNLLVFGKEYDKELSNIQIRNLLDKNISYLDGIVQEVVNKLNLRNVSFKYRFMKSRWGSCNYNERVITLNKYLIHFDENIVKSVICHEIAHLYVPNHSKDFYDVLSRMDPYYKKHRQFLKIHSYVLN